MPILKTIVQLVATTKAKRPWWDEYYSIASHLQTHADAIANLSVGAAPAQFAPYDTRFTVAQDSFGSNAYVAVLSPVATGLALPSLYSILFIAADANTAAATLDVGSTDGAIAIKKYSSGSKVDIASGDIVPGLPIRCTFDGTHWVMQVIPAPVSLDGYATEAYADAAAAAVQRGLRHLIVHTGSGTHNFQPGTTRFYVEVIGGGGGGGRGTGGHNGGPGGGGGFSSGFYIKPGSGSATITVGGGGAGGSPGSSGGSSSYAGGTRTLTANGGGGGANASGGPGAGGSGGSASGGVANYSGTAGKAESLNKGTSSGAAYMAASGGSEVSGTHPGGGGGGGRSSGGVNGGNGFRGEVRIWEIY